MSTPKFPEIPPFPRPGKNHLLDELRDISTAAGGEFIGVQTGFPNYPGADRLTVLVVLNPRTGETVSIPFDPTRFETVELHQRVWKALDITNNRAEARTVKVEIAVLKRIIQNLNYVLEELDTLIQRKKS